MDANTNSLPLDNKMTEATAQLGNTTLLLDELYTAYQGIFRSAKDQLQELELDDQQVGRVTDKIVKNKDQMKLITDGISKKVTEQIREADADDLLFNKLVEEMSNRVMTAVGEAIDDIIKDRWKAYLESDECQAALGKQIKLSQDVSTALTIVQHQKAINDLLYPLTPDPAEEKKESSESGSVPF